MTQIQFIKIPKSLQPDCVNFRYFKLWILLYQLLLELEYLSSWQELSSFTKFISFLLSKEESENWILLLKGFREGGTLRIWFNISQYSQLTLLIWSDSVINPGNLNLFVRSFRSEVSGFISNMHSYPPVWSAVALKESYC